MRKIVTVFGNDTDLMIMLPLNWNKEMANILVRSEYTIKGAKTTEINTTIKFKLTELNQLKQLSITEATSMLSVTVLKHLLFIFMLLDLYYGTKHFF